LPPPFERSVFINCPFDEEFSPILQAISFCVVFLGYFPRLAPENADNGHPRLERILELVEGSKFGIHDLSRCKSTGAGEFSRMNMPFELGIDFACKKFGSERYSNKSFLVFEQNRYDYQKTLSDISGWDIEAHNGDHLKAISKTRTWLVANAGAEKIGPALIQGKYAAFQEWYWERETLAGSSPEDIKEYPTVELVKAMHDWMDAGQPT
jgi:hypothetical protein